MTSYFHLSKSLKWSLKYTKWLLSIEILTFRDFGVILWVTSYWHILKWNLSDHFISLLTWKYEVWAFLWWVGHPHKRMEMDFIDLITFGFKRNDFLSFLWYFMNFFINAYKSDENICEDVRPVKRKPRPHTFT